MRAVLDAVAVLAADAVPAVDSVLDVLSSLIPCSSASFNDMTLATGDFRYVIAPPEAEEMAARLKPEYDRWVHQHPLIKADQLQPFGGALRFCDVAGGDQFTETDLYGEFFAPFGLRYQLTIRLPSPPDVIVGYALNRSPADGEFSDRDVAVLNSLSPHLAMHHRHMIDLERARVVEAEIDRNGGWTVLTVRSDGVVGGASSGSVSSSFAPDGRVPPEVVALLPRHGDTVREALSRDVTVDDARWRCVVHPVPVGPSVLLVRRLGDERDEATTLIDLGLTQRQIDVAIALARSGGTNSQLAGLLGISEGTVKKHLETVFRVLGVDSRAAAAVALRATLG